MVNVLYKNIALHFNWTLFHKLRILTVINILNGSKLCFFIVLIFVYTMRSTKNINLLGVYFWNMTVKKIFLWIYGDENTVWNSKWAQSGNVLSRYWNRRFDSSSELKLPSAKKVISNRGPLIAHKEPFVLLHSSSIFRSQCERRLSPCIPDYSYGSFGLRLWYPRLYLPKVKLTSTKTKWRHLSCLA